MTIVSHMPKHFNLPENWCQQRGADCTCDEWKNVNGAEREIQYYVSCKGYNDSQAEYTCRQAGGQMLQTFHSKQELTKIFRYFGVSSGLNYVHGIRVGLQYNVSLHGKLGYCKAI